MKILVFAHWLEVGGTPVQVAAADRRQRAAVWIRERRFLPPRRNAKMKEFLSMGGKSGVP